MAKKGFILFCQICGLEINQIQIRCPRCNTLLKNQLECNGNCKQCRLCKD